MRPRAPRGQSFAIQGRTGNGSADPVDGAVTRFLEYRGPGERLTLARNAQCAQGSPASPANLANTNRCNGNLSSFSREHVSQCSPMPHHAVAPGHDDALREGLMHALGIASQTA